MLHLRPSAYSLLLPQKYSDQIGATRAICNSSASWQVLEKYLYFYCPPGCLFCLQSLLDRKEMLCACRLLKGVHEQPSAWRRPESAPVRSDRRRYPIWIPETLGAL